MRILTLGGDNFTNVTEVDLTPMPELNEVTIGNGTFSSGLTLICEGSEWSECLRYRINQVEGFGYR